MNRLHWHSDWLSKLAKAYKANECDTATTYTRITTDQSNNIKGCYDATHATSKDSDNLCILSNQCAFRIERFLFCYFFFFFFFYRMFMYYKACFRQLRIALVYTRLRIVYGMSSQVAHAYIRLRIMQFNTLTSSKKIIIFVFLTNMHPVCCDMRSSHLAYKSWFRCTMHILVWLKRKWNAFSSSGNCVWKWPPINRKKKKEKIGKNPFQSRVDPFSERKQAGITKATPPPPLKSGVKINQVPPVHFNSILRGLDIHETVFNLL